VTTVERVDQLLREFRRRHPDALAECGRWTEERSRVDWSDWCWLPMAAVHAYLSASGPYHPADLGRVTALTQWRLSRGVYEVDPAVVDLAVTELWTTAGGPDQWMHATVPPLRVWTGLREWCSYVAWPADATIAGLTIGVMPAPVGVFVHLEHDMNTGRPEVRLLVDTDGTWDGLYPAAIYPDRPTLGAALADQQANTLASLAGAVGADVRSLTGPSDLTAQLGLVAWLVLPLALTLIDPAVRLRNPASLDPPCRAERRGPLWRPATSTTTWTITYDSRPTLRLVPDPVPES